ncbi:MAG: DeoR/GlpR family DNA-binding transcription regulator [Kiritimatiellae bacterium]|jgi:DeoR family fructose operon transcriptional repressor|nr:DeoR/GlpR family DNA-binding transcription regulator [Kiritimatiellia bacterium]
MSNNEHKNLAAVRFEEIKRLLKGKHVLSVVELSETLGVSQATIRRDLVELEKVGALKRVHGGAMEIESRLMEMTFDDKARVAGEEKDCIAGKALEFVPSDGSIFLDGGSTVLALARLLVDMKDLTVVTNSIRVATLFSGGGPRVILVGGELRKRSQTFVGALTGAILENLHVDIAFMGALGVSADSGMTTTDPREAYTKDLVLKNANKSVLLVDGSKVDKVSFVKFGDLKKLNCIITDDGVKKSKLKQFEGIVKVC